MLYLVIMDPILFQSVMVVSTTAGDKKGEKVKDNGKKNRWR